MEKNRLIAFTGGGSAGHVTPNLALIENWIALGGEAMYLGRKNSIEEALVVQQGIAFYALPSERLRRYFDWRNFLMPFQVLFGIYVAYRHLKSLKPQALFSKGGFVSLPPVVAAWLNRIPVFIHESDGSLGLANRLSLFFSRYICFGQRAAFESFVSQKKLLLSKDQTVIAYGSKEILYSGSPIRRAFYEADPQRARLKYKLKAALPLLLIFGGSQGSAKLNQIVKESLQLLLTRFQIIHLCGQQQIPTDLPALPELENYHPFEYINEGFADLLSLAELVICRAGANSITELLVLKKPAILVPLSSLNSRGDQLKNAIEFEKNGFGTWIDNDQLTAELLWQRINWICQPENQQTLKTHLNQANSSNQSMILEKFMQLTYFSKEEA
jgi:UDP-N-acetylglucosamine--N-acetylmuramyl-(pentapeptide) pyrophosphoryl-undecaprenol N-acetylglucosamine transferase